MLKNLSAMNIGDKVRFLNDIGGGKITAFRPGGIVLVEDEDGFDIPVREDEVVVIEENTPKAVPKRPTPKMEYGEPPIKEEKNLNNKNTQSLNGKEYLKSKTVAQAEEEEIDENLEARVVRLEMTILKLEARLARLEAENNLRKNEKMLTRPAKQKQPANPTNNLDTLQIL